MIRNEGDGYLEQPLFAGAQAGPETRGSPTQPRDTVLTVNSCNAADQAQVPQIITLTHLVGERRDRLRANRKIQFAQQRTCCVSACAIVTSCASLVFSMAACYMVTDLAYLLNVTQHQ